jgi:hypothetical protein
VITSFSFPFSPNYRIIDAFPPTSFYLPVLSTAILNWGKGFVNKKLQKNARLPKLIPRAVSGSCRPDGQAPPLKKIWLLDRGRPIAPSLGLQSAPRSLPREKMIIAFSKNSV